MQGEPLRCPAHVAAVARPPLFQPGVATESPQAVVNQWKKMVSICQKCLFLSKEHRYPDDLGDLESDS